MSDTLESPFVFWKCVGIHETDKISCISKGTVRGEVPERQIYYIEMNAKIDWFNMVNGILYIGTDRGVWLLVETLFPSSGADALASQAYSWHYTFIRKAVFWW